MFASHQSEGGSRGKAIAIICALVAIGAGTRAGLAQTSSDGSQASVSDELQEITVTARRREESLMNVPVAVSVLSSSDIGRYGASTVAQIAEFTPDINVGQAAGGTGLAITVRGIGSAGNDVGFDQSVSTVIDGISVSRGRALLDSYFDLKQVEVMKGPQALFFGKNSPAGVIAMESNGPSKEYEGYALVSYDGDKTGETIAEAAMSLPITDSFGVRIAVRERHMAGYVHNFAQPQPNPTPGDPALPGAEPYRDGEDEQDGRLTVAYDAGGPFTSTLKLSGTRFTNDGEDANEELVHCGGAGNKIVTYPILGGPPLVNPNGDCAPNWTTASSGIPAAAASHYINGRDGVPYTDMKSIVSSLSLNYTTDKFVLTSVTGYFYDDTPYLMNNDWSEFTTISASEEENFHSISEELRFLSKFDSPVNFMVGTYLDRSTLNYVKSLNLDWIPADPATGNYQWLNDQAGTEGSTESGFAQVIWSILPSLEFDAGARYTHEEKNSFLQNTYANPYVAAAFPLRDLQGGVMDFSGNNVSPEATLSWHPDSELTVYGAYKTGWKSGGAALSSVLSAALTPSQVAFKPEKAGGFEVGLKGTLYGGRLRTITTLYRYTFSDLQVESWDPNTNSYFTTNAAKAVDYGAEEEVAWQATDKFTLRASLSFNHSRYERFPSAQCYTGQTPVEGCIGGQFQDLSGRPTDSAPDKNAIIGFDYVQPVAGNWRVGFSTDVFYSDKYYFDPTQSPYAIQPSFARINASVRLTDGRWEASFLGRNLTNRAVIISGQDRPAGIGDIDGVLARPIELIAQLKRKF